MKFLFKIKKLFYNSLIRKNLRFVSRIERYVQHHEVGKGLAPVVFFVASAHTDFFGLGAAVGLIVSWALRLAGVPVKYYICNGGLSQCVLGSNRDGVISSPPCNNCIKFRNQIYPVHSVLFKPSNILDNLRAELQHLSWDELLCYTSEGFEFGKLCLPSLRWVQRRYSLIPDHFTRYMLVEYILSAVHLSQDFSHFLEEVNPQAVVTMNGTHFPEAVVRAVARSRGFRVITYESGLRGDSIFFTQGIATEYIINVPTDFVMGEAENKMLDFYMEERRRGGVPIAGRRQWDGITELPIELLNRFKSYRQIISVFTNTVWDTSQAYADRFFTDMFDWLNVTLKYSDLYKDTLFVIRAHPDEARFGKSSNETVENWLLANGYTGRQNLIFISPKTQLSSYELIKRSRFCVVYNSTIGLEAALMGRTVLAGGWTRYRNAKVCLDVKSREDYEEQFNRLLNSGGELPVSLEYVDNARRFYFFSQYKATLDFSAFLKHIDGIEYKLKSFKPDMLTINKSKTISIVLDGILKNKSFFDLPRP